MQAVGYATPCHWRKWEMGNLATWSSSWMTRPLCLFAVVLWDHLPTISIPSWHGCLQCSSEWCNGTQPGHPWVQLPPGSAETRTYIWATINLLLCSLLYIYIYSLIPWHHPLPHEMYVPSWKWSLLKLILVPAWTITRGLQDHSLVHISMDCYYSISHCILH